MVARAPIRVPPYDGSPDNASLGSPQAVPPLPVSPRRVSRVVWLSILSLAIAVAAVTTFTVSLRTKAAAGTPSLRTANVACEGRLEPEHGVIKVAAPYYAARPSVIRQLFVEEGDWVRAGQIIAILDGNGPTSGALHSAEAELRVARRHLEQVRYGEKHGDISAQEADLERSRSALANAEAEYKRYQKLFQGGVVSSEVIDQKRTDFETAQKTVEWSEQKLSSISEVRATDLAYAEAQVSAAEAEAQRARADRELTIVRAPISGKVLKIHIRPGEQTLSESILNLGAVDRMFADAEVYESDIGKLHVGQRATVTADLLSTPLSGTVTEIGTEVTKNELLPLDPAEFADARVMKVKVKLDDSRVAAKLVNVKVKVIFQP
jgi:HlyD family secretion protein